MKQFINITSVNQSKKKGEVKGGNLKAGDQLEYKPRTFTLKVITLSDRASHGIYPDRSGPKILEEILKSFWHMFLMVNDIDSH